MNIVLDKSYEHRRAEFKNSIDNAFTMIEQFAATYNWQEYLEPQLITSAQMVGTKTDFDQQLVDRFDLDDQTPIPSSYSACIKNNHLCIVLPEVFNRINVMSEEDNAFTKLIAHELGHALFKRLKVKENIGTIPIWLYEGFAIVAANQFKQYKHTILTPLEIKKAIFSVERINYRFYGKLIWTVLTRLDLPNLLVLSKKENFNTSILELLINQM